MLASLDVFAAWGQSLLPTPPPTRDKLVDAIAASKMIRTLIGPIVIGDAPIERMNMGVVAPSGWVWRQATSRGDTIRIGSSHPPRWLLEAAEIAAEICDAERSAFAPIEMFRDPRFLTYNPAHHAAVIKLRPQRPA